MDSAYSDNHCGLRCKQVQPTRINILTFWYYQLSSDLISVYMKYFPGEKITAKIDPHYRQPWLWRKYHHRHLVMILRTLLLMTNTPPITSRQPGPEVRDPSLELL